MLIPKPRATGRLFLRMLLLSASLHLALLVFTQPTQVREFSSMPPIQARLVEAPAGAVPTEVPVPASPSSLAVEHPVEPSPPVEPEPASGPQPEPERRAVEAEMPPSLPEAPPVLVDSTWHPVRELDSPPQPMQAVEPVYPEQARRRGIQGSVRLQLKVDVEGRVREVVVLEGSPPGVFDASAREAFLAARFSPALKDKRPVRALVEIRVYFQLQ